MSTGYMRWGTWAAVSTVDAADASPGSTAASPELNDEIEDSERAGGGAHPDAVPEGLAAPGVNAAGPER